MFTDIKIDTDLDPRWHDRITRQVHFKLGSTASAVKSLVVKLTRSGRGHPPLYHCAMEARLSNGAQTAIEHRSELPNMCVADTAARLARIIRREKRFAQSH